MIYRLKYKYIVRWKSPSLRNRRISRAGTVHRSEMAESHVLENSIAQKSQNSTRRSSPPLRNCIIPRVGRLHRSEIAKSHALEYFTARESFIINKRANKT